MGYAVFHATKGSGAGGKLGAHIDRDQSQAQTFKSADPERLQLNKDYLNNEFSKMKLEDAIAKKIESGYKGKKAVRKDAVKFIPMVMTASHKEMKDIFTDKKKANDWVKANYDFACREFGKNNIVRVTLHLDEKTPHLHIVAVPLTEDGRLSAKEIFGDVQKLSARQDRYAEAMKSFGLERGIKGSKSVHTSEGWYIAKQKEAEKAFSDPVKQLSFFDRINPLKKVEVLTESLKLAVNHKFDSDQKAEREESKVLELSKKNKELQNNFIKIIGNEAEYKKQQEEQIKKIQKHISYEVERRIDNSFSLHKHTKEQRHNFVSELVLKQAKEYKGITQELYEKSIKQNGFFDKLVERAESRAVKNQERSQNQNRNNRLGY
ncbi:MobV family relaxase [Sphingobacterium kitahiroshimense]|uniref:MobV family relaxase n=1 Tax=Sphingobacterium kitahiroshimense TaxID=470446 RepID=UPI003209AB4E